MLVLSRKRGEAVSTDNGVKVTVIEIRGDNVRLGFEADESVKIHRQEVWAEIEKANSTEGETP